MKFNYKIYVCILYSRICTRVCIYYNTLELNDPLDRRDAYLGRRFLLLLRVPPIIPTLITQAKYEPTHLSGDMKTTIKENINKY